MQNAYPRAIFQIWKQVKVVRGRLVNKADVSTIRNVNCVFWPLQQLQCELAQCSSENIFLVRYDCFLRFFSLTVVANPHNIRVDQWKLRSVHSKKRWLWPCLQMEIYFCLFWCTVLIVHWSWASSNESDRLL